MDDLISRQTAIMHFVKAAKKYECGMFDLKEATDELWKVPSVDTDLSDYSDRLWKNAYERGKAEGARIPSAEPEIIRCKDCKHYVIHTLFGHRQGWCERLCDEYDKSLARGTEEDDFCSRAEESRQ